MEIEIPKQGFDHGNILYSNPFHFPLRVCGSLDVKLEISKVSKVEQHNKF